jgi:thiol-disulfide isomerase/thioredoxin
MNRIRRVRWLGLFAVAVLALPSVAAAQVAPEPPPLLLFYGNGCPYCEQEIRWLPGLMEDHPELEVRAYEVWNNVANRDLFVATASELGFEPQAVPTTVFGDRHWVGFSEPIAAEITAAVEAVFAPDEVGPDPVGPDPAPPTGLVSIPLVGDVDVGSMSLLGATAIIGFVDGFNPCSLWVLTILLALVLHTGSRRRVLAVGGVFLTVTTSMYGLYMFGLYGVLSYVAHLDWIRAVMAAVALAFGVVNVKDYFAFKRGPSLTIADSRKPGLYQKMRGVASADKPLPAVLGGTAALAVGVSLLETPCTAGLPLLWVNLLNQQQVAIAGAAVLFAVYMLVFLVDELVVFGAAVATMRVGKLEEHHGRMLKLISGWVMIALAGSLLFVPEAMESVAGAVAVFVVAAVLAVVSVLVDSLRRPPTAPPAKRGPTVGSRR